MNKPATWGKDFRLRDRNGRDRYFERGKWHNLIQRVRLNDGQASNGELDVVDGERAVTARNLKFVTNNRGIDTVFYFDAFVVSPRAADVCV